MKSSKLIEKQQKSTIIP